MEEKSTKGMEDEMMVAEAYQHLIDTYLASHHRKHTEIIDKAFNFAKEAHKGVRRLSGEPYIMHPIAVAQIACEDIGLGLNIGDILNGRFHLKGDATLL